MAGAAEYLLWTQCLCPPRIHILKPLAPCVAVLGDVTYMEVAKVN